MKIEYIKRAVLWIKELSTTLAIFWIKNPQETSAIVKFIFEKLLASPRFFSRNIMTEKHSSSYEDLLIETRNLYKKIGTKFNPDIPKTYSAIEPSLKNKAQFLYFLVRKVKPKVFVETGVAAGESTGFILQALKDNGTGKLYSIDLPFQWYIYGNHQLHLDSLPAGKLPGYLIPEKLKKGWNLILGDTFIELPKLMKKLQKIDVFLHDSEHSDNIMTFEYERAWPVIKKGGFLLSDDIDFTKAFNKFAKNVKRSSLRVKDLGIIKK